MKGKKKKVQNPHFNAYLAMQKKVQKANQKLTTDFKRKNMNWKKVFDDSKDLLLLLGECNYLMKECQKGKKKGKWH
ncbi:MAG: hypothetical protein COT84_01735 [Chlamydiae bacterium CG10_big_fil_rev_8_21_14_0_10_35_9]|nr:MAG: hypothetical protein COT84_01735 [Chlamydiae bacterium CG10_big_fil_rev_8_21_14_0_10_35_9]